MAEMSSNINVDVPKKKINYTKAMMFRSNQGLKKELQHIDSQCLKNLANIDRDLDETRRALSALRLSQNRIRRNSRLNVHKQEMDFALMPTPPCRRPRAFTMPLEDHGSLKSSERRHSEVCEGKNTTKN